MQDFLYAQSTLGPSTQTLKPHQNMNAINPINLQTLTLNPKPHKPRNPKPKVPADVWASEAIIHYPRPALPPSFTEILYIYIYIYIYRYRGLGFRVQVYIYIVFIYGSILGLKVLVEGVALRV